MNDIVYIVDKVRFDNQIKYSCIEPFLSEIETLLRSGKLQQRLSSVKSEEELLQLLAYIFFGCVVITVNTSTIAPLAECLSQTKSLKMGKWLRNVKLFGAESKQGNVYRGEFLGQTVVLKQPKKAFFLENTLKDYFNGIYCVNKLRMECPMFAYTYGIFTVESKKDSKDELWLVTEFIKGKTLKEMLQSNTLSFQEFLEIFVQILIALETGQEKYRFCHYDLHTDNIIIAKNTKYTCNIFVYDVNVNTKYRPVLIDYGMSSISPEKDVSIGQHKIEKNGIYHYLFPGYDAYVFLLFCRDIAGDIVRAGIDELFKFYGPIDNTNYVSTLKHNTGRQTPLFFLEHIRKTYPRISIQFSPRTIMSRALLLRSPTIILSDLFFNKAIESIKAQPFNEDNGFIYYMIECTRHKEWFDQENKSLIPLSFYMKMMSRDMDLFDSLLDKALSATQESEQMEHLQCLVNLLFLIKQLKLDDFKPYREWVVKFESEYLESYIKRKPYFDRTERLK